jgi:hypothetical protein
VAAGAWGAAVVTISVIGLALYDYFTGSPRTHTPVADALAWVAAAPGLLFLLAAVVFTRRAAGRGEPRVWINVPIVKPGERFAVKCEIADEGDDVAVIVGQVNRRREATWQDRAERSIADRARPDGRATFEQRFTLPGDADGRGDWQVWVGKTAFRLPVMMARQEP